MTFPALRLRRTGDLLDLPWELPPAAWPDELGFRDLPVGPSRAYLAEGAPAPESGGTPGAAAPDPDVLGLGAPEGEVLPGASVDDVLE